MHKKLTIPRLKQPKDSFVCVPVCVQMAMQTFGYNSPLYALSKAMRTRKRYGTRFVHAAQVLGKMGLFDVVYHEQPYKIPARFVTGDATEKQFLAYVKRKKWDAWTHTMKAGVKILPQRPPITHIARMIEQDYVVIAQIRPKILMRSKKNGFSGGHAVIVERVDIANNAVHVIDPGNNPNAKESYTIEHFEAARGINGIVMYVKAK